MASKIKISESPVQAKATFLRKSAFLTNGDSSFKFNFAIPKDSVDNKDNNIQNSDSVNVNTSNPGSSSTSVATTDENKVSKNIDNKLNSATFSASGSEFKFNFKIDS